MGIITALRTGRGKRVKVFINNRLAFSVGSEIAEKRSLTVGQELNDEQVTALTGADQLQRCLETAVRYLSYRPRSEQEIKEKLRQRGFEEDLSDVVISRLKNQKLIDDSAFTQFWKGNRETFNPRSQRLTGLELRRKGIAEEVIIEAVGTIDEADNAYRAALTKVRSLPLNDYEVFRRRLGGYLGRRGFGYEIINRIVKQVWKEARGRSEDSVSSDIVSEEI